MSAFCFICFGRLLLPIFLRETLKIKILNLPSRNRGSQRRYLLLIVVLALLQSPLQLLNKYILALYPRNTRLMLWFYLIDHSIQHLNVMLSDGLFSIRSFDIWLFSFLRLCFNISDLWLEFADYFLVLVALLYVFLKEFW